jgi:flagellar L-ring protein precursor FlgH
VALLAGCAATPSSIVQGPTSVRPMMAEAAPPSDGAIYNASSFRPMFEDRRARHIGDLLTDQHRREDLGQQGRRQLRQQVGQRQLRHAGPAAVASWARACRQQGATKYADGDNQSASTPSPAPSA